MSDKATTKQAGKRYEQSQYDQFPFLVTREEIIGEVRPGNGDFLTPVHAALDLVATQVADGMYGVFRFPSAEQGQTFTLHIAKEGSSDNGR